MHKFVITFILICNDKTGELNEHTPNPADNELKEKAQAIAEAMGLELSSAMRVFPAQMVREMPFRPATNPFYGAANQEVLRASLAELTTGRTVTRSLEELRSME